MKQVLSALLARLGASANRPLARQLDVVLDSVTGRLDQLSAPVGGLGARLDGQGERLEDLSARLDQLSARLGGVEASLGALHRAVEDLAAIPALSTELVDGITEAEARAAGRLAEVERLLANR